MSGDPVAERLSRKPWRHGAACVIAHFRLTPKSSKDAVDGITETSDGPTLHARVRAVAENGDANRALEDLVARWLGVPKRSVSLATGGKWRITSLRISGDPPALDDMLQHKAGELQQ